MIVLGAGEYRLYMRHTTCEINQQLILRILFIKYD